MVFRANTDPLPVTNATAPIFVTVVGLFASDPTLCVGIICATSQVTMTYNILDQLDRESESESERE
jgi:hypothetical protein